MIVSKILVNVNSVKAGNTMCKNRTHKLCMLTSPEGNQIHVEDCISVEIQFLWEMEITVYRATCGSGERPGYINVAESNIWKMRALGYRNVLSVGGVIIEPEKFSPKTI